ncbi:helix-turn-helix transcriptional regulator [Salmonella enterica]|uniref:HTH luxR-type domain-containing protein n=1 Tax=Salmonella enterica TaxID=28901 RepID=A0A3F3I9J9_SALER|nr:helix-turn-helix transcriptional regulator [Salmonella enterica]EDQ9732080.1 helix-turn-helix transcriptional regulator [Salmonella enterica subsp. enterica]EDX5730534.1 helix-turn-helix transcriptional regulator [Salmonella enterica subsp. enterica serovar Sandiego]EAU2298737.1 helix-turn-helix transcriptional regulator [Salmonella enterica]EAU5657420.1 helix-turn-helix transcriptional regulator [Salmonella enterica]
MMHIFTTTPDRWLMAGIRIALQEDGTEAQVYSVASAGELLCEEGNRLPPDSVLLPVFPDNQPVVCVRSLVFFEEWIRSGYPEVPCLLWGRTALISGTEGRGAVPVMPWRLSPACLRDWINQAVRCRDARVKDGGPAGYRLRLSARETAVLRYTLAGCPVEQITAALGVKPKTVWGYRRRAMNLLGIKRLADLMLLPQGMFSEKAA